MHRSLIEDSRTSERDQPKYDRTLATWGSEVGSNERNKLPHPKSNRQTTKITVPISHNSHLADPYNPTSMKAIIYRDIELTREAAVTQGGEAAM